MRFSPTSFSSVASLLRVPSSGLKSSGDDDCPSRTAEPVGVANTTKAEISKQMHTYYLRLVKGGFEFSLALVASHMAVTEQCRPDEAEGNVLVKRMCSIKKTSKELICEVLTTMLGFDLDDLDVQDVAHVELAAPGFYALVITGDKFFTKTTISVRHKHTIVLVHGRSEGQALDIHKVND